MDHRHRRTGVTEGNRTPDLQDHNLLLYQLSYGHQGDPVCHIEAPDPPVEWLDGALGLVRSSWSARADSTVS